MGYVTLVIGLLLNVNLVTPDSTPKLILYPLPHSDTLPNNQNWWSNFIFQVDTATKIIIKPGSSLDTTAAMMVRDAIRQAFWRIDSLHNHVVYSNTFNPSDTNVIAIGLKSFLGLGDSLPSDAGPVLKRTNPEGYFLKVKPTQILVCGNTDTGDMRGAATLTQLIAQNHGGRIVGATIRDWPDLRWRAASWGNSLIDAWNPHTPNTPDSVSAMIKLNYLTQLKANAVFHSGLFTYWEGSHWFTGPDPLIFSGYRSALNTNHTKFWYDSYRSHGCQPIPDFGLYQREPHWQAHRNPHGIEGTKVEKLKFQVSQGDTAYPQYENLNLTNIDFSQWSGGKPAGWDTYSSGSVSGSVTQSSLHPVETDTPSCLIQVSPNGGGGGFWISQEVSCSMHHFYLVDFYIKTEFPAAAGGFIVVQGVATNGNKPVVIKNINYQNEDGVWGYYQIYQTRDWRRYSLGVYVDSVWYFNTDSLRYIRSGAINHIRVLIGLNIPNSPGTYKLWADGKVISFSPLRVFTDQQVFVKNSLYDSNNRPHLFRSDTTTPISTSAYKCSTDVPLSYSYPNLKGDTMRFIFNGQGFKDSTVYADYDVIQILQGNQGWYSNYHSQHYFNYCPLDSINRAMIDSVMKITMDTSSPVYVSFGCNEPAQAAIHRDWACYSLKAQGKHNADLAADHLNWADNLVRAQNQNAMVTFYAEPFTGYHSGGMPAFDALGPAKDSMNQNFKNHSLPIIWGYDSSLFYDTTRSKWQNWKNNITNEVNELHGAGYKTVLSHATTTDHNPAVQIEVAKEMGDTTKVKGYLSVTGETDAYFFDTAHADSFKPLVTGIDLAWNWDQIRMTSAGPDTPVTGYNPAVLHRNKGDIFSPTPANFTAARIDSTIRMTWFPNLNRDFGKYRIDRWDGTGWDIAWRMLSLWSDTACIDTSPIWVPDTGSAKWDDALLAWDKGRYARYRISAFDDTANGQIPNQSPYDSATVYWPFTAHVQPWVTAYTGQLKIINAGPVFHLVWTGGMADTVVYYRHIILNDTSISPPDTLGSGKFPALVVKHGAFQDSLDTDTLGVAFLSKHSDTIYYRYQSDTTWQTGVVLYSGDPFSLSAPRMALDGTDTIHITFAEKNARGDSLTLWYGKFHVTDPDLTVQPVASWLRADSSASIDSLGAAVAVDYLRRPHLAWLETDTVRYGVGTGGAFLKKTIDGSATAKRSVYCDGSPFNVDIGWTGGSRLTRSYWHAGDTSEIFRDTVYTGRAPANAAAGGSIIAFEDNGKIMVKLRDAVNRTWSSPETLSGGFIAAGYPQLATGQFIDSADALYTNRFVLYTVMDADSLYELAADIKQYESGGEYGITPYAYLKLGRASSTPFTVHRDGWRSFGSEDYKKIDYGLDSLVYLLPSLDTGYTYRLFTEFYFDTTGFNGWKAKLAVNGISVRDTITVIPRQRLRLTDILPAGIGQAGYLRIKLTNLQGV